MASRSLLMISLKVDFDKAGEFNDFYHHRYIPRLLEVVPELVSARRYEEYNVDGSLRWYVRQYLTIYEFASEDVIEDGVRALERPGREAERAEWTRWIDSSVHEVSRTVYRPVYAHPRAPADGPFASRPFFMVSVEVRPERESEFNQFYHGVYLPRVLADGPTWAACRRYKSEGRSPTRYITVYEAPSVAEFSECLAQLRSPSRQSENLSWHRWQSGDAPAILWEDAASFKPIFRCPG